MKKDIHPNYRPVVFKDISTDFSFLTKSSVNTKDKIVWEDGKEYPLVKLEISSASHPFYTGKEKLLDTAGRVDKFFRRYGKSENSKEVEGASIKKPSISSARAALRAKKKKKKKKK